MDPDDSSTTRRSSATPAASASSRTSRGRASRAILDALLEGLCRVRHRGAIAADRKTGDGAGLLLPLPDALLPEPGAGLAMVFLRDETARARRSRTACRAEGIEPRGWREVPVDPDALGAEARGQHAADRAARRSPRLPG